MLEELAQEAGTLIVFLAGISYIGVGIYLLQTTSRENGGPSFWLGLAFLCNGFSFGFSEIFFVANVDQFLEPLTFMAMYIVYELHGVWSGWLDVSLGLVEVISVIALWLSFTAPPFYRRWFGASAAGVSKN